MVARLCKVSRISPITIENLNASGVMSASRRMMSEIMLLFERFFVQANEEG